MADFTVGIIGGGPAGAATASYLAKAGVDCVVFERELFPRPHVGETFVPSSNRVFAELGFTQKMEEAGFLHKEGAVWTSKASAKILGHDWDELGDEYNVDIAFREREMPGVNNIYTYHVDRAKFDLMLLQHANELGASVYEGVRVTSVDFDDSPRINFRMGRKKMFVNVNMVIDASGRHTLLGRQLKLKIKDPVFNQFALHTWFKGVDRGETSTADYLVVYFLPFPNTWVWQIPITKDITSIGIVTQKTHFPKANQDRETWFWQCLESYPELHANLRAAERVRPFTAEGDYSYAMKAVTGDNFALVGDAARFVDPIFSSGVSVALNSARFVTPQILKAAENGNFTAAAFNDYAHTIRVGTRNWYKFITLYYRLNILFTQFINDPKYRLDVLKLLQGDVYDEEEPPVLAAMQSYIESVEGNEDHMFHHVLGQLSAEGLRTALT